MIPTHGRPTLLGRTIDSILACDAPPARQVQLIVVENGPKSDAEQVVAPKASWLTPEYRHVATASKSAALNSVLHELDECLMIFFDDDIRVEPTILQEHSVAACVSSSGGFFGGGMPVHEEPPSEWLLNYLTFSARGWHSDAAFDAGLGGGLAFLGCSWSSLASDLRAVGGSDRRFGPGGTSGDTGYEHATQAALRATRLEQRNAHGALACHYVLRERCSTRRALLRVYCGAITRGHDLEVDPAVRRVGGVPPSLIRLCFGRAMRAGRAQIAGGAEERVIRSMALMVALGQIRGLRERRKSRAT